MDLNGNENLVGDSVEGRIRWTALTQSQCHVRVNWDQ